MFARGLIITPLLVIFIESVCFSLQCMSAPISIIDKITIRQAVRLLAMIMIVTIQRNTSPIESLVLVLGYLMMMVIH